MTLDEVIIDIRLGRSKQIYFSECCLWWTHLESDLQEATRKGREYIKAIAKKNESAIINLHAQTDPLGNRVKVFPEPYKWVRRSMTNPGHFGKHGLKAFMKTHHQNCNSYFSNRFQGYNDLIDQGK